MSPSCSRKARYLLDRRVVDANLLDEVECHLGRQMRLEDVQCLGNGLRMDNAPAGRES